MRWVCFGVMGVLCACGGNVRENLASGGSSNSSHAGGSSNRPATSNAAGGSAVTSTTTPTAGGSLANGDTGGATVTSTTTPTAGGSLATGGSGGAPVTSTTAPASGGSLATGGAGPKTSTGGAPCDGSFAGSPGLPLSSVMSSAQMTGIELDVNLRDGTIGAPRQDEKYVVEISSSTITYTASVNLVAGAPVIATATPEQLQLMLDAVLQAPYRTKPHCITAMFVDGAPFPPKLKITDGTNSATFSVSDKFYPGNNRSAEGNVISCAAYETILKLMQDIVKTGTSSSCSGNSW
jgi:hypothetical protein